MSIALIRALRGGARRRRAQGFYSRAVDRAIDSGLGTREKDNEGPGTIDLPARRILAAG
jgi:hypothetical protein